MQTFKHFVMKHNKCIGTALLKYFISPIVTTTIATIIAALILAHFGIG